MEAGDEGVLAYLKYAATQEGPFFLIVSLVNPHDVRGYPSTSGALANGYDESWLQGDLGLPSTVNEDMSSKPGVQRHDHFQWAKKVAGRIPLYGPPLLS